MRVLALIATVASGVRLKRTTIGSCAVQGCYTNYDPSLDCQCNSRCDRYGNCCSDFGPVCRGSGPSPAPVPPPPVQEPSPAPPPPSFGPSPPGAPSRAAEAYWEGVSFSSQTVVKSKIRSGFRRIGYSGLWTAYKSVWVNLPGRCQNGVYDIYSTKCWTPGSDQCGSYRGEGDCYNREHSWPKSWWGGSKITPYSDVFHVMPSDGYVNGRRSSHPFGEVTNPTYVSSEGHKVGPCASGTCFEPTDRVKGTMARGHFYMSVRYRGEIRGTTFSSSNATMLLNWHTANPPQAWEVEFNNRAYLSQRNRNPFIDFPDLAQQIFR